MLRSWPQLFGIVLAFALFNGHGQAQPGGPPAADKELVVATKETPPFAMKRADGSWHGISIDLWRHIADRLHLRYRLVEQPTVQSLIDGTAKNSFDVAIAALTVTAARERAVEFTQPFYTTGLGIAVPASEGRWMQIFRTLSSFGFFQAVLALLGIAICVGFVIWLLERRKTDHFAGGIKGFGSGVWWSAVAMTQAGAAQNAPATVAGRIVATSWMIASVIAIAVFTAGITSALTKRELQGNVQGVNDLRSIRVGAVTGSATVGYLDHQRISHRGFANPRDGLKALQAGTIDAFVYDKPLLTWIVLQDFSSTLRVLDVSFDDQNYAIALPKSSALREKLDIALLEEIESDWWQQTLFQYLGREKSADAKAL
ncbi:MAG TPA: transporter substrate-binding domain-containing protein [Pseudolabrys sp.]|nr:transporter substrate-binding domain-containing protein [Pseudolabrys sp.]